MGADKKFKDIQRRLKQERPRIYLNRDFESIRTELLLYAKTYFADSINDFSENSVGGLFIELASYVGDIMGYYLDHQFNELDLITAVEPKNIEKLVRSAGVKIKGAAPATVYVKFTVTIPSEYNSRIDDYVPATKFLPVIQAGTIVMSSTGVKFELGDDLDFTERNSINGRPLADWETSETNSDGTPKSFAVSLVGLCKSGLTIQENFTIPDTFVPFRTISLKSSDVSEIISINDTEGNVYYEVDALTQDVVYKRMINTETDLQYVPENLELIPAPYRFISTMDRRTRMTSIRFGGGDATTLDNDVIPDPSEVALPLFGKKRTFSRFSIDPNSLLGSETLGITPRNTTLAVVYRAGGGLSHNVGIGEISTPATLLTKFDSTRSASEIASIRSSVSITNSERATGGEAALTLNELRTVAIAYRNAQSRLVTKEDLMARIYSMPPNFGRVFRAGARSNPNNPLAMQLSVLSRDRDGLLVRSQDNLKENLRLYLNEFRIISDAIDIVDADIVNLGLTYQIVVDNVSNKTLTLQKINATLSDYLKVENFQIDQPVLLSDLINLIINSDGVVSLMSLNVRNISGTIIDRTYSDTSFNVTGNTDKGMIFPPEGAMFEFRYPSDDIIGSVV